MQRHRAAFTVALIPNPWRRPFGLRCGASGIPASIMISLTICPISRPNRLSAAGRARRNGPPVHRCAHDFAAILTCISACAGRYWQRHGAPGDWFRASVSKARSARGVTRWRCDVARALRGFGRPRKDTLHDARHLPIRRFRGKPDRCDGRGGQPVPGPLHRCAAPFPSPERFKPCIIAQSRSMGLR